jgi:putative phosphonate metabolism protein
LRYALYFSPAATHPLTRAAAAWLGRDAFTNESHPLPKVGQWTADELAALTADPRRYGFHATLKAPFALAPGRTEAELVAAFEQFASRTATFEVPEVIVGQLGRFFALVPSAVYPQLQDFAASVVDAFDMFRAPLSDADIARRKPDTLTASERANLDRWGYPYVGEDFRFHMTLTGQVEPRLAPVMREALEQHFAAFHRAPLAIDSLALFVEPERGAPFHVHRWLPLAAAADHRKTAS